MYTFNKVIKDEKNISARRREIIVEFTDKDGNTLERDIQFSFSDSENKIKKAFKDFLDEINLDMPKLKDIDYVEEVEKEKTKQEKNKEAFETAKSNLVTLKEELELGIITDLEYENEVTLVKALKTPAKVKTSKK